MGNAQESKAIPHKACAEDALSDFSSDCIEIPQAYWSVGQPLCQRCWHLPHWGRPRMSKDFCARWRKICTPRALPSQCQQLKGYWHLPRIKNQIEYLGQNTLRWWENTGRGAALPLMIGTGCFRHSNISWRQISSDFSANSSIADSRYLK